MSFLAFSPPIYLYRGAKMNRIINISNREKAIKQLKIFKQKRYEGFDIKFENVHLKKINETIDNNLFDKNDLYIYVSTLFDIMQQSGTSNQHHKHSLTEEDIIDGLRSISDPYAIICVNYGRYSFVTEILCHFDMPLLFIIELHSGLYSNPNVKINKIVTIYPKNDIEKYLCHFDKKSIIYRKK